MVGLRVYTNSKRPHEDYTAKTLFPNMVTFTGTGGIGWQWSLFEEETFQSVTLSS